MKFGVFDYIEGSEAPLHKTYHRTRSTSAGGTATRIRWRRSVRQ